MSKELNIGLVGAGRIGQLHAKHLSYHIPEANLLTISDLSIDSARQCATRCNTPKVVKDYRDILDDQEIEAIFICSSTDTHARMIIDAADAGKHIFCEKPIAFNIDQIDKALDAVYKAGVKFQVGFNRRFDPSFKKAQEFIKNGKIGDPQLVRITSRSSSASN